MNDTAYMATEKKGSNSQLLVAWLKERGWQLSTAESCTGGLLASTLTDIPGSSLWFDRGFVTYSRLAKQELLSVSPKILGRYGTVSEPAAQHMALGAIMHSHAHLSVAITGVAGPAREDSAPPVGTICLGYGFRGEEPCSTTLSFSGDRRAIKKQAVQSAIAHLLGFCQNH